MKKDNIVLEIKNIKKTIDNFYLKHTVVNNDFPNNLYFRTRNTEDININELKQLHISINHYLGFLTLFVGEIKEGIRQGTGE